MTPDELSAAGQALYGDRWQSSLARDVHVSDRTVRRWLAGDCAIPARVERELQAALKDRIDEIGGLIAFDVVPEENSICYSFTGSCFRYDPNGGVLIELTAGMALPGEMQLIRLGAKEKLRAYRSQGRQSPKAVELHGFMRGSVVVPPEVDLTEPVSDDTFVAGEGDPHR